MAKKSSALVVWVRPRTTKGVTRYEVVWDSRRDRARYGDRHGTVASTWNDKAHATDAAKRKRASFNR